MIDEPITKEMHEQRVKRLANMALVNALIPPLAAIAFYFWMDLRPEFLVIIAFVAGWMIYRAHMANVDTIGIMGEMMLQGEQIDLQRKDLKLRLDAEEEENRHLRYQVATIRSELQNIQSNVTAANASIGAIKEHYTGNIAQPQTTASNIALQQGQTSTVFHQQG